MKTANFKGYTLIELLIGMTIITVVFTVGVAGFRSFSRRQALSGVTKSVLADLRSAQQFALNGQKPTIGSCPMLQGYTFKIVPPSTYQIVANCVPDIITTKSLPSDVSISGSSSSVQFKVLGQGTDLTENLVLTLTHTKANITNQISIGTGGNIE